MEINSTVVSEIVRRILEQAGGKENGSLVPVGVSNRHIHLTAADVETLFGKGYELTKLKDLSQPGQYACKETRPSSAPPCGQSKTCGCSAGAKEHPGGDLPHRFLHPEG